jgi:hypothetical protein
VESYDKKELAAKKETNETAVKELLSSPTISDFKKDYPAEQIEAIVRKAQEYGIDPAFLLALRKTENGREGREFGVLKNGIDSFEGQLIMSCRTIQNNVFRYKRMS